MSASCHKMAVADFSSNATERVELPVAWLLLLLRHTARRGMHGPRRGRRSYGAAAQLAMLALRRPLRAADADTA